MKNEKKVMPPKTNIVAPPVAKTIVSSKPALAVPAAAKPKTITSVNMLSQTKMVKENLFEKENYKWMLIGLVIMAIGFFLMSGGKSADPNVFNDKDVYSTTRITIAPILIIAGLLVEIYAIMRKPKIS